ncbi:MAG: hypothetical protein PHD95_02970 [Candidatus ainarchaeum sp.]|nr:hypothetical protein [Candidatus ainarchaeum sp.]
MSVTSEEIKQLVIARLETMPSTMKVSLGDRGVFNKEELIAEIQKNSDIGEKIIEVHLNYLRSFSKQ